MNSSEALGVVVLLAILVGGMPARIAHLKGRKNITAWWLFGIVLFPVALIAAYCVRDQNPHGWRSGK